ncbi:hypothetical protein [Phytobacter massiliensis]|uniref:hypothetical protein n=1 Tax=Phytobacter massiliensis TaxID=1485952 RepID=UPI0008FFD4F4|nr:hypothetical protein [Phytobacter massiliensis]
MSGFQLYNSAGALTIDSTNKSIVASQLKSMGNLSDTGFYQINSAFGNGSTLGFLGDTFFPGDGLRWFQLQVDGKYCFPGSSMYEAGSGQFMLSSNSIGISSGYLDVFDAEGTLIWSAVGASSMPRIMDFFTVPASHDLSTALTLNTTFTNPWICISQCPGNLSDDGSTTGYSGVLIRRNNATSFTLQYVNRNQKSYTQAMGSNGFRIALARFTGY